MVREFQFVRLSLLLIFASVACSTNKTDDASFRNRAQSSNSISNSATAVTCGNGIVEAGEDCDGGSCCDRFCHFRTPAMVCDFVQGTKCSGSLATCATSSLPTGVKYFAANDGNSACAAAEPAAISPPQGPTPPPNDPVLTPGIDSQFIYRSSVNNHIQKGLSYLTTLTFKNAGTTPWSYEDGFYLGMVVRAPDGSVTTKSYALNGGEVVPKNGTKAFGIWIKSPNSNGDYAYTWRMVSKSGGVSSWFGQTSDEFILHVEDPPSGGGGYCLAGRDNCEGDISPVKKGPT